MVAVSIAPIAILTFGSRTTEIRCERATSPQNFASANCEARTVWLYGSVPFRRDSFALLEVSIATEQRTRKVNRNVNENYSPLRDDAVYREDYPVYAAFAIGREERCQLTPWNAARSSDELERRAWPEWLAGSGVAVCARRFPLASRQLTVAFFAAIAGWVGLCVANGFQRLDSKVRAKK